MPPSYWNAAEWPSPRSSTIEIFRPRVRKAVSRRRSSSVEKSKSSASKMSASGRNVTVVPVGAPLASFSPCSSGACGAPRRVLLGEDVAVAADLHAQPLGQRVDDGHADAVQPAGDLVAAAPPNLPPACSTVSTTSTAGLPSFSMIATGMPRPLSTTVTELSGWIVTDTSVQKPARASSTELSTTS